MLVWNGIYERLTSQFHLLENSNELNSHPMLTLKSHWHYYSLCAEMYQGKLVKSDLLKPQTVNTLKALTEQKFEWLGNVPFSALAKLRENNENEDFRRKISGYVTELHEASLNDLDKVAMQVGRGIESLIRENEKKIKEIELKYRKLHEQNAFFAWITLGVSFFPTLAPFAAGGGAISIAGRYVWDKFNEYREKKQISQSLIGVLAAEKE